MSVAQYPPNDGEGNKTLANGPEKARAGAKSVHSRGVTIYDYPFP